MASAETRAELVACIQAAQSIVDEAIPEPGEGQPDITVADLISLRGAAMSQTVRELFGNEVEGV
jgi:hypothetical protein